MTEERKRRAKKPAKLTELRQNKLDEAVTDFGRAWSRVQIDTADKNLAQEIVIELMAKLDMERHTVEVVDESGSTSGSVAVTIVRGERVITDWDKFRNKVGAAVWKKITKPAIDRALVDQALKEGLFKVEDIAECSTTVPNSPYLKPTIKGRV